MKGRGFVLRVEVADRTQEVRSPRAAGGTHTWQERRSFLHLFRGLERPLCSALCLLCSGAGCY